MKKLIAMMVITSLIVSCNDPKPPPDETKIQKPDSTQVKELPKQ